MKRLLINYEVIAAHSITDINTLIAEMLEKDYEPFGSPSVAECEDDITYVQGMALYEDVEVEK